MPKSPLFHRDAFAARRFTGNPAAVMWLESFPPDELLQALAAENNLAETAFIVPAGRDYDIRWFTPTVEVPLCGHATLASAAVVLERLEPGRGDVVFHSKSGPLTVRRSERGYLMKFPARRVEARPVSEALSAALGAVPLEAGWDGFNMIALLQNAAVVAGLAPDLGAIERLPCAGVVVTAHGNAPYDFTSRYFAPAKGIPEDPVTGGAHCALAPFWAERLGRTRFLAFQASRRGGEIACRVLGDRVELEGQCIFYSEGVAEF